MTDQPLAVVSMSGGKDSTATALVAIQRYGRQFVRLVMADTGHEHPETMAYVQDYLPGALGLEVEIVRADFAADFARKRLYIRDKWPEKGVDAATVERALALLYPTGVPFLDLCMWKGRFPSRKAQFCTEFLKRNPLDAHMIALSRSAGVPVESWQGVRRDESLNRRDALERERSDWGWDIVRPIVAWTAADTFAFMAQHGVKPNPLYSLGMKRVGCMPCINCGKDELLEISKRWPAEIERVAAWERLVADCSKRGLASFFFLLATGETDGEYAAANSVGSLVAWAHTSRGGKQFDMERLMPAAACSSVYGLCE